MALLEESWEQRESDIYIKLFGDIGSGIYTLSFDIFLNQFACDGVDPRWLHYGVFKSPPNKKRKTWLYVSSGMSNPWETEAPEEYSGLGTEFILETRNDESWAVPLVQSLIAYNILLSIGRYGDKPLLDYYDRIPAPIKPNISHVVLGFPQHVPGAIDLVSGRVDFLQIVGITKSEFEYAKSYGSDKLCDSLAESGIYPITDPLRESVIEL